MLFWTIFKVSMKSLLANKLRTFLAMLGIVIGVGAVIAMLALGSGAQKQQMERMTAMGTNLLVIRPGARGTGGVMSGTQQNLTQEDGQAITTEITGTDGVAPVVGGSVQVKHANKNSRVSLIGTMPNYMPIRNFQVELGRNFTDAEATHLARVAVLGPMTVENLFGSDDPLGEMVKMNGINFRVIGVLKSKGDQGYFNPDDQVIIPLSTAMKQVLGVDKLREIDIQVAKDGDVTTVQDNTTALLRKRHRLLGAAPDDFSVRNQADAIEAANATAQTMNMLLGGIASISLLVGGIGIMNIMLVTVTERTREIGVRKAIGAKEADILTQFLIESIIMSVLGGIIGVGVGFGSAPILGMLLKIPTIVETYSVILSLTFSCAVGVFFGFYPAHRAAQLDAIVALRYE